MKYFKPFAIKMIAICCSLTFFVACKNDGTKNDKTITAQALPEMWVPKDSCISRRFWFKSGILNPGTRTKSAILWAKSGLPHPLSYRYGITTFLALLDELIKTDPANIRGIDVYITAYDSKKPSPFDGLGAVDKQLVLVFAAADANKKPLGKYYAFTPDCTGSIEIPFSIEQVWFNNYINNENQTADGLISTIESNAPENLYKGKPSDTQSIYYKIENFTEFMQTELQYQNTNNGETVSGIEIDLASYSDEGVPATVNGTYYTKAYKNRLIIQFEFTKHDLCSDTSPDFNKDKIFYIDDEPDFCDRYKITVDNYKKRNISINAIRQALGADKGLLCPPNCP